MTPDIPKGPEGEDLRARIERAINDEAPVWDEQFEGGHGIVCSVSDAAVVAARAVQPEVERLTAEVRRSTESRDRAIWLTRDLTDERDEWKRSAEAEAGLLDQANAEHKAEVSRLREQLAARQLPPNASYRIGYTVVQRLREAGVPLDLAQQNFVPQIVRDVMASWRASSSEVEAPQPQPVVHYVTYEHENDEWQATCSGCPAQATGSLANVHFWKDQHEADTLVPQVGGVVRGPLNGKENGAETFVSQEIGPHGFVIPRGSGGGPSGSERLAPRSDEELRAKLDLAMDTLGSIWLYVNWHYVSKQLTTEQKELWADAVDEFGDPADRGPKAERWWRDDAPAPAHDEVLNRLRAAMGKDAAQAARSEATPHPDQEVLLAKIAELQARGPVQYATEEAPLPSPSLPKEGEDSG